MNVKKTSGLVAVVLMVVLCLFYYNHLTNKTQERNEKAKENCKKTELELLLEEDLDMNYPSEPRAVVKFYCRIVKCAYNDDECSEKNLEKLNKQMRKLFSTDLINNNTEEEQFKDFKKEIKDYQKNSKIIMSYTLSELSQVQFYDIEGEEMARLNVVFSLKTKKSYPKLTEQFILRKENDQWKIVGWTKTTN